MAARSRHQPLVISTFEDLATHEPEIVRRINDTPNGGRLLLIDASRLFADIGVILSEAALAEWRSRAGLSLAGHAGSRTAYDAVAQAAPDGPVRVRVRTLLRKENP